MINIKYLEISLKSITYQSITFYLLKVTCFIECPGKTHFAGDALWLCCSRTSHLSWDHGVTPFQTSSGRGLTPFMQGISLYLPSYVFDIRHMSPTTTPLPSNYKTLSPRMTPQKSSVLDKRWNLMVVAILTIRFSGIISRRIRVPHQRISRLPLIVISKDWKTWRRNWRLPLSEFKAVDGHGWDTIRRQERYKSLNALIRIRLRQPRAWCHCLASMSGNTRTTCSTKTCDPITWMPFGILSTGRTLVNVFRRRSKCSRYMKKNAKYQGLNKYRFEINQ